MPARETGGGQSKATRRTGEVEEDEGYHSGEDSAEAATAAAKERQDKLSDDVDAILDEIDEVLEENAEEFVRGYVQKGGE